jgi:hypothetical protein
MHTHTHTGGSFGVVEKGEHFLLLSSGCDSAVDVKRDSLKLE